MSARQILGADEPEEEESTAALVPRERVTPLPVTKPSVSITRAFGAAKVAAFLKEAKVI